MSSRVVRMLLATCCALAGLLASGGALAGLPTGERWLTHVKQDLLPFWSGAAAMGKPIGNFPTFRCNDGSAFDPEAPCEELKSPPAWIRPELGRSYVRMQARQTYAYGVAYHLTGDVRWLELARAGARRTVALLDPQSGSPTWFEAGRGGPEPAARTAQDQSYAVVGIAMLYYLTRDPALEQALIAHQRYVFSRYWDADWGMLRWVPKEGPADEAAKQELVAQLDQLNAYMLLVVPYLPAEARAAWHEDIRRVARALIDKFHDPARGIFYGTLERGAESRRDGARHNDFGHTIKAYWMLMLAGRELGDAELERFGHDGGAKVLERAWDAESGAWGSAWHGQEVDTSKSWWIYAELDQMASFLALERPELASRLESSWRFWLTKMTAPNGGEIYGWVDPTGAAPANSLRIHQWKNGYHSFEHALVSYLTAQALAGKPATLHFALQRDDKNLRPYLMQGKVVSVKSRDGRQAVEFAIPVQKANH